MAKISYHNLQECMFIICTEKDQIADPNLLYNNKGTVNVNGRLNLENTQEDKMFITYHVFMNNRHPPEEFLW